MKRLGFGPEVRRLNHEDEKSAQTRGSWPTAKATFGSHAPNTTAGVVPAYASATGLKTASSSPTKIKAQ